MASNGTYSLLELTQIILSATGSDEVNSISDTTESMDTALLLKVLFYELVVEFSLEQHNVLIELTPSIDVAKPVLMTVPEDVTFIDSISYNNKEDADTHSNYVPVTYLPFRDFLERTNIREETNVNLLKMSYQVGTETFEVSYRNDRHPTYYTDIGGKVLLFDSFNAEVDDTLQKSKTQCFGSRVPSWTHEDSFVPPLRANQFPLYINRAKERAYVESKQMTHNEANRQARRLTVIERNRHAGVNRGTALSMITRYGRT